MKKLCILSLITLLAACAPAQKPVLVDKQDAVPSSSLRQTEIKFTCDDGKGFSIAFSKSKNDAILVFAGQEDDEQILENSRLASGIEYANEDYAFREHQGISKLADLTQGDEKVTVCKKTKQTH